MNPITYLDQPITVNPVFLVYDTREVLSTIPLAILRGASEIDVKETQLAGSLPKSIDFLGVVFQ